MPLQLLPNSGHWSYWHPVGPDTQLSGSLHNQECLSQLLCNHRHPKKSWGYSSHVFPTDFPASSASAPPGPRPSRQVGWQHGSLCLVSLQLGFEDLIAEPETTHSFDKVWICSHALFEISKYVIYKFLTVFLAIPLAFVTGILFATLSCLHIWWEGTHGVGLPSKAYRCICHLPPRRFAENACIRSQAIAGPEKAWRAKACFL